MKYTLVLGMGMGLLGTASAGGDMIIDFPGLLRPRASAVAASSSTNLLAFSSALGGQAADPVTSTGDSTRPFAVGTDTFTDFETAATRSCNNQHNACAGVANAKTVSGLTVGDCDTQQTSCEAAAASGPPSSFTASSNTGTTTAASVDVASAAAQTSSSIVSVESVASTSTTSAFAVQGTLHSSDDNFLFFCD
ncbi:uncharacterized protein LY89DRAFT_725117 [Mollisia scopiformis]|uniref:Uncharacterized protein n=1 Tax=Mollisia scopiformis TaxID=149040 RepID=A0A132B8H8_MOLSC|nr:uncharacterized protein LY89DRAFT_725117 [Mollisia scopiformis]KUJ08184.1 hypothetical protein LY89DRAFT_725117 [Mollisia scopiformis]